MTDLPIAKRLDYQDKSNHLEVPSPLSLPSDFSVDMAEYNIPLDPLPPADGIKKHVEGPSSMIAENEHLLIPGLVEKAKAALDLSKAVETKSVPSVVPENRVIGMKRFHSE